MADAREPFLPMIFKGKNRSKEPKPLNPQQVLSKQEISRATKSLKQNICVEMLQNGDHRSFSEFFRVLSLEQRRRESCDPRVVDSLPPPLQEEKLHNLKQQLTQAEQAQRTGGWSQVCERFLALARFFSAEEDEWLRLHFLLRCCEQEHGAGSRAATEARAELSETCLQHGDLEGALRHAQLCLQQAEEGGWLDSSGRSLKSRAQGALWGIYTRQAHAPLEANCSRSRELLQRALRLAHDSGDKHIEGEALYNLAVTSQLCGEHSTAKKYLQSYMSLCEQLQNPSGLGKAYKALAKSLESEGDTQGALLCLQKLCDGSVNSLPHDLVEACISVGNIHFNMGSFGQAGASFQAACDGAAALGDFTLLHEAQVLVGWARAHSVLGPFSAAVGAPGGPSLQRLLDWKDKRQWDPSPPDSDNNSTARK